MRVNPPAPAVTGDVVRFTMISVTQGQTCFTTHDYMSSAVGDVTHPLLANLATAFDTAVTTPYLACLPTTSNVVGVIAEVISTSTVSKFLLSFIQAGLVAAAGLPLEIAAIINRSTILRGGHGVGRFSMPAIPVTFTTPATDPNRINAAGGVAYTALCVALQTTFPAASAPAVSPVVSTRPVPPALVVSHAQPIISQAFNTLVGTVRRRKEGRGI
jgi:hypothetical protein